MITASALLLIVGTVLLVVGIFSSGTALIFASIIVTAAAGLLLGLGIVADRKKPVAVPAGGDAGTSTATSLLESTLKDRAASPLGIQAGADDADEDLIEDADEAPVFHQETARHETFEPDEDASALAFEEEDAPAAESAPRTPAARKSAAKKTAAKKTAAKKTAAKKTAAKKSAAKKPAAKKAAPKKAAAGGSSDRVVVIPGRDKFHTDACRYASGDGAMTVTKTKAKAQGYKACGVCKP